MELWPSLFKGVILPGAGVFLFLFLSRLNSAREERWILAAALPVGFWVAEVPLFGFPRFEWGPPESLLPWLVILTFVAGVFCYQKTDNLFVARRSLKVLSFLLWLVVMVLALVVLFQPLVSQREDLVSNAFPLLGWVLASLVIWWSVQSMVGKTLKWPLLLGPLISYTALSLLALFSGSASMGQRIGVVCSVTGVQWLFSLLYSGRIPVISTISFHSLMTLFISAYLYLYLDVPAADIFLATLPLLSLGIVAPFLELARGTTRWVVFTSWILATSLGAFLSVYRTIG